MNDSVLCVLIKEFSATIIPVRKGSLGSTIEVGPCENSEALGKAIHAALEKEGLAACRKVLALDSCNVLHVVVEGNARLANDTEALSYATEAELPWHAEELLVSGRRCGAKRVSVVACKEPWLEPVIRVLNEGGPPIRCVAPASLLVIQQLVMDRLIPESIMIFLRWFDREEVLVLGQQSLEQWSILPKGSDEGPPISTEAKSAWAFTAGAHAHLPVVSIDVEDGITNVAVDGKSVYSKGETANELIARSAERFALPRSGRPWFHFQLSRQVSKHGSVETQDGWYATGVLVLLMLAFVTGGLWLRGQGYLREIETIDRERLLLAQRSYPDVTTDRGLERRLLSERDRLQSMLDTLRQSVPDGHSLTTFWCIVAALPELTEYQEIRSNGAIGSVLGASQERAALDALVAQLTEKGFQVERIRSNRGFRLELQLEPD